MKNLKTIQKRSNDMATYTIMKKKKKQSVPVEVHGLGNPGSVLEEELFPVDEPVFYKEKSYKPHFLIDFSYQPINRMWGAKIKHGNIAIFEIDENPTIAVSKAVKKILEYEKC